MVEIDPVYAGIRQVREGPLVIAVEVATPLSAADKATLWPIRRNLVINLASALALLPTVGLTGWASARMCVASNSSSKSRLLGRYRRTCYPGIPSLSGAWKSR